MRRGNRRPQAFATLVLGLLLLSSEWAGIRTHSAPTSILTTGVYYDTYQSGDPHGALAPTNASGYSQDLTGWIVTDGDTEGTIHLEGSLDGGASIRITQQRRLSLTFPQPRKQVQRLPPHLRILQQYIGNLFGDFSRRTIKELPFALPGRCLG